MTLTDTPATRDAAAELGINSLFGLHGRTAVVTGASRGIGAVLAEGLAAAHASVVLIARSAQGLEQVADRIRSAGGTAFPVACDLTDRSQAAQACREVLERTGGVDILVNNAGGPLFQAKFLDVREEGWDKVFDLNLTSVVRITRLLGRGMVERGSGSVINISSIGALQEWPEISHYCAAKAALLSLTRSLAADWAPRGVRVNAICPGWIDTDVNRAYTADPARRRATGAAAVPLGGWAPPGDVLGTTVWLASNASRFVTGAVIPLDGGSSVGMPAHLRAQLDPTA
ncbi:SDR family NAD(P)-dependent oxidoreductase [Streptomyces olivoreticuli]